MRLWLKISLFYFVAVSGSVSPTSNSESGIGYVHVYCNFTCAFQHPLSVNVTIGEEAVFLCQHPSVNIDWRLNGTTLRASFFPQGVSINQSPLPGGGGFQHTLTITALLEYDNTTIECVTESSVGSPTESTVPVILRVQG